MEETGTAVGECKADESGAIGKVRATDVVVRIAGVLISHNLRDGGTVYASDSYGLGECHPVGDAAHGGDHDAAILIHTIGHEYHVACGGEIDCVLNIGGGSRPIRIRRHQVGVAC